MLIHRQSRWQRSTLWHKSGRRTHRNTLTSSLEPFVADLTQAPKSQTTPKHTRLHPSTSIPLVLGMGRMRAPTTTTQPFISPHKALSCLWRSNQ